MDKTRGRQPGRSASGDLRVWKTKKALHDVLLQALHRRNFLEITVNDLCQEALISRGTFYAHFKDKYDLLSDVLTAIRKEIIADTGDYERLARDVNGFIAQHERAISNLLRYANSETSMILRAFMEDIVQQISDWDIDERDSPAHIVHFNFVAGGLVNQLTWLVEHNFPKELAMVNPYLYRLVKATAIGYLHPEGKEPPTD